MKRRNVFTVLSVLAVTGLFISGAKAQIDNSHFPVLRWHAQSSVINSGNTPVLRWFNSGGNVGGYSNLTPLNQGVNTIGQQAFIQSQQAAMIQAQQASMLQSQQSGFPQAQQLGTLQAQGPGYRIYNTGYNNYNLSPGYDIINGGYNNGYNNYGYYPNAANYQMGYLQAQQEALNQGTLPRQSETVKATKEKNGKLLIKWSGDSRIVDHIVFATLDKNGKVIKQQTVKRLPAQASFSVTSKTAYYGVEVNYLNGAANTTISPSK